MKLIASYDVDEIKQLLLKQVHDFGHDHVTVDDMTVKYGEDQGFIGVDVDVSRKPKKSWE